MRDVSLIIVILRTGQTKHGKTIAITYTMGRAKRNLEDVQRCDYLVNINGRILAEAVCTNRSLYRIIGVVVMGQ